MMDNNKYILFKVHIRLNMSRTGLDILTITRKMSQSILVPIGNDIHTIECTTSKNLREKKITVKREAH